MPPPCWLWQACHAEFASRPVMAVIGCDAHNRKAMSRDAHDAASGPLPDADAVHAALARLEASRAFRSAKRHRLLLRHLVLRRLDGDLASLKESVIAVEVFGRPAATFDSVCDSIVRVEARRLRARLATYNANEGAGAALRIELPVGSYVPELVQTGTLPPAAEATRRARDLVERGEHFLRQPLSAANLDLALQRFDAALRESPGSAAACVGLARSWLNLATGWYRDPAVASEHATEALKRALQLDPLQPLAHTLLGALQNQFHRDWPAAQRSFRRALALAPEAPFVWSAWGSHLNMRGQLAEADSALARARALDPLYANARGHMVNLRIAQGRLADAQAECSALADVAPDSLSVIGLNALLAYLRGDYPAMLAHYRRAAELMPEYPACLAHVAGALALCGDLPAARAVIEQLRDRAPRVSPYVMAIVAWRMGEREQALQHLQTAADTADPNVLWTALDPCLQGLRDEPRFVALTAALQLRRQPPSVAAPAAARRR